jgi:GNAT superfamily N-acetyltransferase
MWVAYDGDRLAGVRIFLRWEFRMGDEPRIMHAVRAVDTATHHDYQGRGLFTRLTMTAVEELTAEGVDFVFNTPNSKSKPGYLKMGWFAVGRVPIRLRPRTPFVLPKLPSARRPAEKWGEDVRAGDDSSTVGEWPLRLPSSGLATHANTAYWAWRFSFPPLGYRVLREGDDWLVFRVRRRGPVRELSVSLLIGDPRLVGRALHDTRADVAIGVNTGIGFKVPGQGVALTARPLCGEPPSSLESWALTLADLELF